MGANVGILSYDGTVINKHPKFKGIDAFEHGAYEEGLLYVKKCQATLKVDDKVVETLEKNEERFC